jgi:hypothetical protein
MRGYSEEEALDFVRLARRKAYIMRWSEFMPLDADQIRRKEDILTGILPPILAAATQSLPDLGILANSAQLLRHLSRERKQYRAGDERPSKPSVPR